METSRVSIPRLSSKTVVWMFTLFFFGQNIGGITMNNWHCNKCWPMDCNCRLCLKPEKPGVAFCIECNRKLTQGSPTCVRCGKCARLRRQGETLWILNYSGVILKHSIPEVTWYQLTTGLTTHGVRQLCGMMTAYIFTLNTSLLLCVKMFHVFTYQNVAILMGTR